MSTSESLPLAVVYSPLNSAVSNPAACQNPLANSGASTWYSPCCRQPDAAGENIPGRVRNLSSDTVPNDLHTHFLRHRHGQHFYLNHPVRPLRVDVDRPREWCGKASPTILITDSVVRRCCSLSAAAGLPRPFLSMTTPGFAQAQSPQGPAPAKGIFEKAIHTVNK